MRRLGFYGLVLLLIVVLASGGQARAGEPPGGGGVVAQATLGTAFTYQGFLKQSGSPVNGTCDFQFSLWDDGGAGSQVGTTLTSPSVGVTGGLFTVFLDFGASPFGGEARWLGTSVSCPAGSGEYTPLSPRQALTAAPYALYATAAGTAASATTASTAGTATSATTANTASAAPWSGLTGVPAGFADGADDVGWSLAGNAGTSGVAFLGTTDSMTLTLGVGGTAALRLVPSGGTPNLIGGYSGNAITSGATGATIGGGGSSGGPNAATDSYATVGGGYTNRAGDDNPATFSGYATVGGGNSNTANSLYTTVGGGNSNTAGANYATVGGGNSNTASGFVATVPGGGLNTAAGDYSFAAGYRAKANHQGSFVWGDSTNADVASSANDTFVIRATNGVVLPVNAGDAKAVSVGERYRDNAVNAWAKITSTGVLSADYGVSSVVKSTGIYTITLDLTFQSAVPLIPVAIAEVESPPTSAAAARLVTVNQISSTQFAVYITTGNFASVDNDFVFMVTGR